MNIVNKLTLRQLKLNKRRTLVTILGVIISVAMVTAVAVSAASGLDLMKRVTISTNGNWHMKYHNIKAQDISVIEQDDNVEQVILDVPVGYARLENVKNSNKPYLFVRAYNAAGFEQFPVELVKGQLPKNSYEIVVPEHLERSTGLNYKIGDKITLNLGKRYENSESQSDFEEAGEADRPYLNQGYSIVRDNEGNTAESLVDAETKTYTVVGIIKKSMEEQSWSPGYELISYIDQDEIPQDARVDVAVLLKDLKKNIYENNASLGMQLGIETVEPHSELLACYGVNSDSGLIVALVGVVVIVMLIIMLGSVSLIYNAFAISVAERSQYLGMLASVGATKKQKRASVFFEGTVIGCISIPLGLLAGFLGMGITFGLINNMLKEIISIQEDLYIVVSPWWIMGTVLIAILTIFISTYVPARRASKVSAIEAIKQTADIKINHKAVKTSRLTHKLFGFEGELALKNLKRNGRRYRATLFSLIISIVLFLVTAAFSAYMAKSIEMMIQTTNYDIRVTTRLSGESADNGTMDEIKVLDGVESYNVLSNAYLETYLDERETPDYMKSLTGEMEPGRGYYYSVRLQAMEDAAFETYAKSAGADISLFSSKPAAILLNRAIFKDKETKKRRDEEAAYLKAGDQITLAGTVYQEEADGIGSYYITETGELTIGAIAKEPPMGIGIQDNYNMLQLIMPKSMYEEIIKEAAEKLDHPVSSYEAIYLTSKEPFKLQQEIEALDEARGGSTLDIYNIYEQKQSFEQIQIVMKVFIYGFIVLITLISVANIFNTISTSIALRKREFAMLRSVGMTPKGFNKMINFESIFYGLKALLYGLPVSLVIMVILYQNLSSSLEFDFFLPVKSIITVIISVFVIVGIAMFYSGAKVKGENIIEGLKDTNL